jgi:hypothetical protein
MHWSRWTIALGLSVLAAGPLCAEIIEGVMSVKGCEMS